MGNCYLRTVGLRAWLLACVLPGLLYAGEVSPSAELKHLREELAEAQARYLDLPAICNGRLTLTSGNANPSAEVSAANVLYFTPYRGSSVSLYDGTRWKLYKFTEISLSLVAATMVANSNYDVFLYDNAGTLTLELSAAWTDNTTRNDTLVLQDGIYVKTGATTRRYLGTIRASNTNVTDDSLTKRFVWNYYNRVTKQLYVYESTNSWSYVTSAWRPSRGSTSNRAEIVTGMTESNLNLRFDQVVSTTSSLQNGICEDCTANVTSGQSGSYGYAAIAGVQYINAWISKIPSLGYHYYQMTEISNAGTNVFNGGGNGTMLGNIDC